MSHGRVAGFEFRLVTKREIALLLLRCVHLEDGEQAAQKAADLGYVVSVWTICAHIAEDLP